MPIILARVCALFIEHRKLRRISPASIALYERHLLQWQEWRKNNGYADHLDAVDVVELRHFFHYLNYEHVPHGLNPRRPASDRQGLSPASVDTFWRILRALWSFLDKDGLLDPVQRQLFSADRVPRPVVPQQVRPVYSEPALDALLAACDDAPGEQAARDRALLLLLATSGMRVSEVCNLQDEQIEVLRRRAVIRGKGDKPRPVFWSLGAAVALARYIEQRSGAFGGPVFRSVGSRSNGQALTTDAVRSLVRRLAERAGVTLPPGAPIHALRHRFAHRALDADLDISQIQQLMGHADIATTMIYLREHAVRLQQFHTAIWQTDDAPHQVEQETPRDVVVPFRAKAQ